ncbi:MAG: TolC family protein [Bacteroidales bacterium]
MIRGYRLPFFITILLFGLTPLYSQKIWSLKECVEYALESNIDIKERAIEVEQRENLLKQQLFNYLPSINSSINHSMNWGRSVNLQNLEIIHNKLSHATSANLGASLNIFEGNIKRYNYQSAQIDLSISQKESEQIRDQVVAEVIRAYLQLLLSGELLELSKLNLHESEAQVARATKLVEAGSAPLSTRLEMEAQASSERVSLVEARNGVEEARLHLELLLNLPQGERVEPEPMRETTIELPPTVEELLVGAERLPQFKIAELTVERAEREYLAAKGRLLPTIYLSASYGTFFSDGREERFFEQFKENRNPSMGMGLSIPILNNLSARSNIKNRKLGIESARLQQKKGRDELYSNVMREHRVLLSQQEKIAATESNVAAMKESFNHVKSKFEVGLVNGVDYSIAKGNLFKAQSELLQSKYHYLFQLKIIDLYLRRALFGE